MSRFLKAAVLTAIVLLCNWHMAYAAGPLQKIIRKKMLERKIQKATESLMPKEAIEVDGRERAYVVHLPPDYNQDTLWPLVIALHGGGGNAENIIQMSGLSEKADESGFIVVYPNGTGQMKDTFLTWNAANCCGYALDNKVDDIKFIRLLIEQLKQEYSVDSRRIFVTGISNGAKLAYDLACRLSDTIAAIAPVAGSFDLSDCSPQDPVAVIIFHGTADQSLLYRGGVPKKIYDKHQRVDHSVAHAVAFWVEHNGCITVPKRQRQRHIIKETYAGGKNNTEVVLYTIRGGGHAWPGGEKSSPRADEPTQEISATDLMWQFFLKHPKKSGGSE